MKIAHIQTVINAQIQQVWDAYNNPKDIKQWNQASPEWFCPTSENDLRVGGKFKNRMEAKDGSFGFDFEGEYTEITPLKSISYRLGDNRTVHLLFTEQKDSTSMDIKFDAEEINSLEMQQAGWQAILDSFKNYIEQKNG